MMKKNLMIALFTVVALAGCSNSGGKSKSKKEEEEPVLPTPIDVKCLTNSSTVTEQSDTKVVFDFSDDIELTYNKGNSTVKLSQGIKDNHVRFYKNSNFVISAVRGFKKIVFEAWTADDNAVNLSNATLSSGTFSLSEEAHPDDSGYDTHYVTWENEEAVNSLTVSLFAGKSYVNYFTITLE